MIANICTQCPTNDYFSYDRLNHFFGFWKNESGEFSVPLHLILFESKAECGLVGCKRLLT